MECKLQPFILTAAFYIKDPDGSDCCNELHTKAKNKIKNFSRSISCTLEFNMKVNINMKRKML